MTFQETERCSQKSGMCNKEASKYVSDVFKSPYGELRKRAGRSVMYVQRLRAMLTEVYKAYFNICPKYNSVTFL